MVRGRVHNAHAPERLDRGLRPPPQRLPHYYKNHDFEKLARKMIFGTDWPGVPGIKANALSLIDLGLKERQSS